MASSTQSCPPENFSTILEPLSILPIQWFTGFSSFWGGGERGYCDGVGRTWNPSLPRQQFYWQKRSEVTISELWSLFECLHVPGEILVGQLRLISVNMSL
ncbi:unnamed protein product [Rangifer tarandus platyrhynchus]|uniref:Uncharacterized protein n=1 Tax=Rangifer tarandus platyrhynchus TaxID=3082113 RepID=A0AC59ZUT4_RANTA